MDDSYAPHVTIQKTGTHVYDYGYNSRVMFISVLVLLFFCLIFGIYHLYSRFVQIRRTRALLHHRLRNPRISFTPDISPPSTDKGLEPSILNSLSTFIFVGQDNATMDCAVCLSEFEQSETGRVLPGCNHGFHVECIDTWFMSNSTCPLCRAPVHFPSGSDPDHDLPETIIDVDPVESGLRSTRMVYSSSSSSLPQLLNIASVTVGTGPNLRIGSDSRVGSKPMAGPARPLTRFMSI